MCINSHRNYCNFNCVAILRKVTADTHSRFLKESSHTAAHQQEELLGEEDPGDLLQGGLCLTPQVKDGGSQEGDAQAEAEEHAPVCERLLPVELKQRTDPLVQQHHDAVFASGCSSDTPHADRRAHFKRGAGKVNGTHVSLGSFQVSSSCPINERDADWLMSESTAPCQSRECVPGHFTFSFFT